MSKKVSKKKQSEIDALAQAAADAAQAQANGGEVDAPKLNSYEIKKADRLEPVSSFDPRKNLRTVTSGVWRYIAKDISEVSREDFQSYLAKEFGIKENDLVFVVANGEHKIVTV